MTPNAFVQAHTVPMDWTFLPAFLIGLLTGLLAIGATIVLGVVLDAKAVREDKPARRSNPKTHEVAPRVSEMALFVAIIAIPTSGAWMLPYGYAGNGLAGVISGAMFATILQSAAASFFAWKSRPPKTK